VLQNDAWLQPALKKPPHVEQMVIIVCALPLYHIFALTACFLLGDAHAGGANMLIPNPRDMAGFVKELRNTRSTASRPSTRSTTALLNTPGFDKLDFSKLKISVGGGMAVQKPVAEKLAEGHRLRAVGRLRPVGDLADADLQPADIDRLHRHDRPAVPSTEISIRDDDGNEVPLGEPARSAPRARR
jgi:long-chain acyl-CoA synthetase